MSSWWPLLNLVYRAPLSGDVSQDISQGVQFSGDLEIELDVYKDAGSPGRQLGRLTDAVVELDKRLRLLSEDVAAQSPLIKSAEASTDAFDALAELATSVSHIKERHRHRLEDRAKTSLEQLREAYPDDFKRLVNKMRESDKAGS